MDSLQGPTGFANDGMGISWGLAEKFDIHYLGLQSVNKQKVKIKIEEKERQVIQHPNIPRGKNKWDFGKRSLPILLDSMEPNIVLTVNDIQMVQHIPNVMCPNSINLQVLDLPSKKEIPPYAMEQQLMGELQKFREKFPRECKWVQYAPQDGDPPMPQWENVYKISDQVVAMADYGKWVFKKWFDMDVPRIWHGVDTAVFKNQKKPKELQNKFIIGNFNRNQPRKQPVRNMIAFARFAKDKPDAILHLQMDWKDEFGWPIGYFAQQYGIQNKMMQPKPIGMPREEVAKTYNMWDLNINSGGGEGFGLCEIEGMACGIPNIAQDYTTTKELTIDGEPSPRGTMIKIHDFHWQKMDVAAVRRSLIDCDDLSKIFNKYYYNRDLVIEHGKNAEEWTKKNCSWSVIAPQWIKLMERVLSGDNKVC